MTTPSPEAPLPQIQSPTPEGASAVLEARMVEEVRALAQEIRRASELGFTPSQKVKAIVQSIATTTSPPTMTVRIGGDTTTDIPGVRMMSNVAPYEGQTVLLEKQGSQVLAVGAIANATADEVAGGANGWTKATLTAGSHNGNNEGDICYRRVMDNGSWKMQWCGGWSVSGTTLLTGLASEFRPSSRRTLLAARDATNSNVVKLDFNTDGSVSLVGGATGSSSVTVSGDVFYMSGSTGGESAVHTHVDGSGFTTGIDSVDHSHVMSHDHVFSGGSHSHSVPSPSWVSLNGLEYFL